MFPQSYTVTNNICLLDAKSLFCVSWLNLFLYLLIFILLAVILYFNSSKTTVKPFSFSLWFSFKFLTSCVCLSFLSFFLVCLDLLQLLLFSLIFACSTMVLPFYFQSFLLPRLVQHQRFLKHLKHYSCVSMLKITYWSTPSTLSLSDCSLFSVNTSNISSRTLFFFLHQVLLVILSSLIQQYCIILCYSLLNAPRVTSSLFRTSCLFSLLFVSLLFPLSSLAIFLLSSSGS